LVATVLLRSTTVWLCGGVLVVTALHLLLGVVAPYRQMFTKGWRQWHYAAMTLNLLWVVENAVYRSTSKQPSEGLVDSHRLLLGLACCMNWLMLIAYLELQPAFRHLGSTLRGALPVATNFIIGALPIFLGYCLFGAIFFGRISYHFATLEQTAVTLFAVLNGDIVLDTFHELDDPNSRLVSLVSAVFLYSFIPLMIYGMVNVFLVITEEAYHHAVQKCGDPDPTTIQDGEDDRERPQSR